MPSPVGSISPGTATTDLRPAVTVLSGFAAAAADNVARPLLAYDPRLLLVRHDLSQIRAGVVRRLVRDRDTVREDEQITLVHGCVSCTLREDVLPTLVRLGRAHPDHDLVLMLPEVVEPEAVAEACAWCLVDGAPVTDAVRFDSYVTVVDAARLLDDLSSTDDLIHRDMQAADEDHRAVADVVARQIEYADTVVLWGEAPGDGFETARLAVLLERLAPWAAHVAVNNESHVDYAALSGRLRHTGRHRPDTPGVLARGIEGYGLGVHEPQPDCGVVSTVFRTRRPFHPQRLHDALEEIAGEVLRSRGHLWLASQPDLVVAWESAGGGLFLGSLGRWLAALPDERWQEASADRRAAASLRWDPYYGDRGNHLVFIGLDLDVADLHSRLAACLVTDEELAGGQEAWTTWADPFAACFEQPTEGN